MNQNHIITIGRELGSGGRTIGKRVAEKLGIAYYDYEIIDETAKKSGFSIDFIKASEQRITHSLLYNLALGTSYGISISSGKREGLSLDAQLFLVQQDVVKEIAERGDCVIVGRCADAILKECANLLRVFVYADMEFRKQRVIQQYGYAAENAEKKLQQADKKRASHYLTFTEQHWGSRSNYDIVINSSLFGIDKSADMIIYAASILGSNS